MSSRPFRMITLSARTISKSSAEDHPQALRPVPGAEWYVYVGLLFETLVPILDCLAPRAFCQIISATAMNRAAGKGVTVMDSHQARARSEASFKKEERAREGAKAMMEYEAGVRATQEKTARLRALRLAKE